MATTLEQIGVALQGFGAGVGGRGNQFLAAQQLRKDEQKALTKERQLAGLQDGREALVDLKAGRTDRALARFQSRIDLLGQDPGASAEGSQGIVDFINAGDLTSAISELQLTDDEAVRRGLLSAPPGVERLAASDVSGQGQTFNIDPATGQPVAVDVAGFRPAGEKPKDIQPQVNALRKDVFNVSKSFRLVDEAFSRINKTAAKASAAGDISLIFNFMKMNDPGSTVREGEFATAQNASGVPGRVVSMYNNLLEGTRLNPEQRADFVGQAETLFNAQREATDGQIENILQQADQDSIPRQRVFGKERLEAFNKRSVRFLGFE